MAEDPYTACAEQLALTPGLVRQLLVDHAPTEDGWCQGHHGHHERHPCSIRRLAEMARAHATANGRLRTPA
ncbi:hypothetical protein [Pseudonocardia humida]|uniref:Uncharacterized protein n=1 Tax=Pseudonocardia humida TaxID=2800819 RepID=A0ABT1A5N6_9PSEU|nr:hypothetical protein [Pseudonocardia humida]MCO1658332.1 hypothetical protein [Pseudonocardia humida]